MLRYLRPKLRAARKELAAHARAHSRHIGRAGLELVKSFEGLYLNPYLDPVGVWTIGWGHTGEEAYPGNRITKAKAEELLRDDLGLFELAVQRLVKVPLNENERDALISFAYNVGAGGLAESTLLRKLNAGDRRGAADEFLRWTKGGGRELPGLVRRRKAERELFLSAV